VDVEHQVLKVCVDASLRVDCRLLISQQVVELDDTDRDGLILLRFQHDLFECCILDDLVCYDCREMPCLCHIPPVIAVQRCVQIVSQALEDLKQLLFFEYGIFKVDSNLLLLIRKWHSLSSYVFAELSFAKAIHRVESAHDTTGTSHA